MEQWLIWLIIVSILAFFELITNNLVTIWFVISGIFALILSIFIDNIPIQFAVFMIGGIILLLLTKPILMKHFNVKKEKTNVDRIIGMEGEVTEEIINNKNGAVKIDGKEWTAFSSQEISKGKLVKVLEIKGVKLKVEEIK